MPGPTFYYDLQSPYSWLAAERVDALFAEPVEWVPILVGAIFAARGRRSWGVGPEREDGLAVIERRAAARGLPPVRWPDPYPGDGLRPQRAAVYAHREGEGKAFALAAFRVHFVEGRTLNDEDAIVDAAGRAGLDPAAVLAATADQAVKDVLRSNTDTALDAGVFGVPTVLVDGDRFWGDDRLEEAAAHSRV